MYEALEESYFNRKQPIPKMSKETSSQAEIHVKIVKPKNG